MKYVAFLRAINVGGHVVKMDQLKKMFEAIGLENVESVIASGNIVFDSRSRNTATLERKIAAHLESELGYPVFTFVRSVPEIQSIAEYEPFSDTSTGTLYIGFLAEELSNESAKRMESGSTDIDVFHLHGRELYWLCRAARVTDTKFSGPLMEKTLGTRTTMRNVNTIKRIADKYS